MGVSGEERRLRGENRGLDILEDATTTLQTDRHIHVVLYQLFQTCSQVPSQKVCMVQVYSKYSHGMGICTLKSRDERHVLDSSSSSSSSYSPSLVIDNFLSHDLVCTSSFRSCVLLLGSVLHSGDAV